METATVLVADDDRSMAFFLTELMKKEGHEVHNAFDGPQALGMLERLSPDVALLDVRMPGVDGLEILRRALEMDLRTRFIVITAFDTREVGVEAMKLGAFDYFPKPLDKDEVQIVVRRAIQHKALEDENRRLRGEEAGRTRFGNLIGRSPAMQALYEQVEMILDKQVTVLMTGESGTGKELVAEAVHYLGERRDMPFIKFNCAAIPDTLLESELFGYERGAFTGAAGRKPGKFERAHGGSILLDEIGDMGPLTQAKVLRFLEERTIERLGGTESIPLDVRIMAATNRDLSRSVRDGMFREDLLYRLNVISLHLPPLRERTEDIPLLVDHFLERFKRVFVKEVHPTQAFLDALFRYSWPGNVRELENVIQRSVVMCQGKALTENALPETIRAPQASHSRYGVSLEPGVDLPTQLATMVDGVERDLILQALEKSEGRRQKAADILGISRKTLHNKMLKYALFPAED